MSTSRRQCVKYVKKSERMCNRRGLPAFTKSPLKTAHSLGPLDWSITSGITLSDVPPTSWDRIVLGHTSSLSSEQHHLGSFITAGKRTGDYYRSSAVISSGLEEDIGVKTGTSFRSSLLVAHCRLCLFLEKVIMSLCWEKNGDQQRHFYSEIMKPMPDMHRSSTCYLPWTRV